MTWQQSEIAPCGTHHTYKENPLYGERFDEVLKFHTPGFAPVRLQNAAWHIRADGQPVYARRFVNTFGYYDGFAAVQSQDGWHHIDDEGEDLYPQRYFWCGNFQNKRCVVRDSEHRYFHINRHGAPAYLQRYRYAGDFRDGACVVQDDRGLSTHLDMYGKPVHGKWFWDLDVFHKGFARAKDKDGWHHVDRAGGPAYARRFATVEPFYNGQARVERPGGGLEVIDISGNTLCELRPGLARTSDFMALSADLVGYWKTMTLAAAVKLRVLEHLPASAHEIAIRKGLREDRTDRLLRALGELGVVSRIEDIYHLTDRGAYLTPSHPLALVNAATEYASILLDKWTPLEDAVRADGEWKAPDIFAEVEKNPFRTGEHHQMLQSYAQHDYPQVVAAIDLTGIHRIVDAGGGLGVLADLLVAKRPGIEVVVLERHEVVAAARQSKNFAPPQAISWIGVDLFHPWKVPADAVVLARVLHDWDDEHALTILRHARDTLRPGGSLFVVEFVRDDQKFDGALCDLHLLMVNGGKERTAAEFGYLLRSAGFELEEIIPTTAIPSVIVGVAKV